MESKSLMIGDWVYCTYWPKPHIVRVAELRTVADDELKVKVYDDDIPLIFDGEFIQPIPLTAEILEKNGFRNIGGHWYDDAADYYELEAEAYSDSIWRVVYHNTEFNIGDERVFVSHIHELQHALCLFGIKKEIEL